jgi:outer membrane protein TolC
MARNPIVKPRTSTPVRNPASTQAARPRALRLVGWTLLVAALGGCATYRPLPLPAHADSPRQLTDLRGAATMALPLDAAGLQRLVLLNNPELRSARAQHDVAQAQMLQAGLLPNPSLSGNVGYLFSGTGDATAWSASLSEDIRALVTLAPRRASARAAAAQVDASLLWQEWQTVGKARLLFVDLVEGQRLLALQQHATELLEQRGQRLRQAIAEGNGDLGSASADLAAAADAHTALNDLQRRLAQQRHELAAMLGLVPDATIPLQPALPPAELDVAAVQQAAQSIERRRPDLVALQLGYRSQEASLRAAVLAQFPVLSFGYSASQDNSRVRNGGPSISLDLPLFDRNQGNIAIARATRQQLHDEYAARLNAAHNELAALLSEQAQASAQLAALRPLALAATRDAAQATSAWQGGLIDLRSYVDLGAAALARQSAVIALEQALLEQQSALDTLIGTGMPNSLPKDLVAP